MHGYMLIVTVLVISLGIGVIRKAETTKRNSSQDENRKIKHPIEPSLCEPDISEGSNSKLEKGGHMSFECDISTCVNVSSVIFEKNDPNTPTQWTTVYEGFNRTHFYSVDTNDGYTLKNRSEYAPFPTQHILFIKPLQLKDHGKWRCTVFNQNNIRAESLSMELLVEPVCTPEISEGSHTKLEQGGHTSFECEISTCVNVSWVIFEKNDGNSPTQWMTVYVGIDKTLHYAVDTRNNYTLNHRSEYAPFPTQHILFIKPLDMKDRGKWRCTVFDDFNRRAESKPMELLAENSIKNIKTIKPTITGVISNQILEFSCMVSAHPRKRLFIWTVNGTEYTHGTTITHKDVHGSWATRNTIQLQFQQVGEVSVGCRIESPHYSDKWEWKNILIDVKEAHTTIVTDYSSTPELSTITSSNSPRSNFAIGGMGLISSIVAVVAVIGALVISLVICGMSRKERIFKRSGTRQRGINEQGFGVDSTIYHCLRT